jgi:tRNA dimethylallyltransferase
VTEPRDEQGRPVIAVVGPTASGKTALGVELAVRFGGEIVNCDSVQVYREIEIATAKPTTEERRGVPYHLLDFVPPEKSYTAGEWAVDAARTITDIETRGRLALLVGGTGFYLRALKQPFFTSPPADENLRHRLNELLKRHGVEHLHRMLERIDPASASRISPRDWVRTIRALEVYFQTGKVISEAYRLAQPPPEFASRIQIIVLSPPREEVYSRINAKAEMWFEGGLLDEVQSLIAAGIPTEAKVFKALGYRHMLEYFKGRWSKDEALDRMKTDTRHLAKRQLTWWRAWPDAKWLRYFGDEPEAVKQVIELLGWDT